LQNISFQYRKKRSTRQYHIMPRQETDQLHVIILQKIWTTRYQLNAITQYNIGTTREHYMYNTAQYRNKNGPVTRCNTAQYSDKKEPVIRRNTAQ